MITDLEPDILECEVKWALESITMNKASGGDGIPVELLQILKHSGGSKRPASRLERRAESLQNGEGDGTPLQYSCLENPMDGGAWWAAVYGVAQSWTRLSSGACKP